MQFHSKPAGSNLLLQILKWVSPSSLRSFEKAIHRLIQQSGAGIQGYSYFPSLTWVWLSSTYWKNFLLLLGFSQFSWFIPTCWWPVVITNIFIPELLNTHLMKKRQGTLNTVIKAFAGSPRDQYSLCFKSFCSFSPINPATDIHMSNEAIKHTHWKF